MLPYYHTFETIIHNNPLKVAPDTNQGNTMKHNIFTLLSAILASTSMLFAESGTCGDNATWDLTDGVLTISGTGAMSDYDFRTTFTPWEPQVKSITSVVVSNGITHIGDNAFRNCENVASFTLPNSLTTIGVSAFEWCHKLTSIEIPNGVESIGEYAFYDCSAMTSISIPATLKRIDDLVFNYCTALTTVYLSDIAAWCAVEIGLGSNPMSYGQYIYLNGELLTDLVIPESVTSISHQAFFACTSLKSLTIGNNVTTIRDQAFSGCEGLTSITFGSSVTTIEYDAFAWCKSLTSVTIPNTITNLESGLFMGCEGLTSLTIGNSVASIGDNAFFDCTSLKEVTCLAVTPPTMGEEVFAEVDCSKIPLFVPAQSVAAYKAADQWKAFNPIVEDGKQDVEMVSEETKDSRKFIRDGQIFIHRGGQTYTLTGQQL